MKNLIYLDIDTERARPILFGKPPEIVQPTTPEEASAMLILDISCVCEALCSLIHMADQSGYASKRALIEVAVKQLNDMLIEPPQTELVTNGTTE